MAVVAMFGPTAVGKTAVAIQFAALLRAQGQDPVAISADSMQVYEGLQTLSGAATAEERRQLEHRLIDFVPVTRLFSVGEFMPLAHREIDGALAAGRTPIVVGGTGLYLRAALTELDLRPPVDAAIRERVAARVDAEGVDALRGEVLRRAPGSKIAQGDRNRVVRYLELLESGIDPDPGDSQLWTGDTRHPTLLVGLTMDRDELNRRIDTRMEAIAAGAIDEVRAADAAGASTTARQALGFDDLLSGDVEALKRKTRQFARRQLTWMRKLGGIHSIDVTHADPVDVAAEISDLLRP